MADTQYDVPEKVVKLFRAKEEIRRKNKAYFTKMMTNPHRPISEGFPFDPQLFRFAAARAYQYEHYKPTPKSIVMHIFVLVVPMSALGYYFYRAKQAEDERCRAGLVTFYNRKSPKLL